MANTTKTDIHASTATGSGLPEKMVDLGSSQYAPAVVPEATEVHLGEVGGNRTVISVTPVCDTSIYAAGDTLFDRTVVTAALRKTDGTGRITSVVVIDNDDQAAAAMDLWFLGANVAFGTLNAAPSITDPNAANILGRVALVAADFIDLGGCKVAAKHDLNIPIIAVSGAATIYVAATTAGTPTQTASGIVLRIGIERD